MSYTIVSAPEVWTPVYNPIEYEVSSSNFTLCNFRYTADIYVNGVYITTLKLFPNLSNKAIFEFNTVIQQYLSYDLNTEKLGFNLAPNTFCNYQIKFGEEYDTTTTCDGTLTSFPNLAISTLSYSWNGSLDLVAWNTYTSDTYKLNAGAEVPFLTNQPAIVSINPGDYAQLMYIQDIDRTTSPVTYLADACKVLTYDSTDSLIGEYDILNAFSNLANKIYTIGVGYQNIQEYVLANPSSVISGPTAPFVNSIAYYTIQLYDATAIPVTELKTYKIDKVKPIDSRRFVFVGALGNMDSFNFSRTESATSTIARNEFTKLNTAHTVRGRGRTVIDVEVTTKFTARSNWLTVKEANWLAEMFYSPEAYILQSTPYYCYTSGLSISSRWNLYIAANSVEDPDTLEGLTVYLIDNNNTIVDEETNSANGYLLDTNINSGIYSLTCGVFYDQAFTAEYTPIILSTNSFESKTKRGKKNLQCTVDYEMANARQIQRN